MVDFQDMEGEVLERVQDLLEGATPLVWVVYPELEQVQVGSGSNSNAGVFCIVAVNEQHKAVEMHPLAF